MQDVNIAGVIVTFLPENCALQSGFNRAIISGAAITSKVYLCSCNIWLNVCGLSASLPSS